MSFCHSPSCPHNCIQGANAKISEKIPSKTGNKNSEATQFKGHAANFILLTIHSLSPVSNGEYPFSSKQKTLTNFEQHTH